MNRSPLHWLTSDISLWDPDICHKISWKTSQASRLYSLVTEVDQPGICGDIWNHHSVSSIVHILWAAKCTHHKKGQMVCCWKGMFNFNKFNFPHHFRIEWSVFLYHNCTKYEKILNDDFSQQIQKEKSLSLLPLNVSWVIWHSKSWGLCLSGSL